MTVQRVILDLCDACLDGEGGECHEPGCSLCRNAAPDLPIRDLPSVQIVRATVLPLVRDPAPPHNHRFGSRFGPWDGCPRCQIGSAS